MATSIPANASSPANISPVGPPPAITTACSVIATLIQNEREVPDRSSSFRRSPDLVRPFEHGRAQRIERWRPLHVVRPVRQNDDPRVNRRIDPERRPRPSRVAEGNRLLARLLLG